MKRKKKKWIQQTSMRLGLPNEKKNNKKKISFKFPQWTREKLFMFLMKEMCLFDFARSQQSQLF